MVADGSNSLSVFTRSLRPGASRFGEHPLPFGKPRERESRPAGQASIAPNYLPGWSRRSKIPAASALLASGRPTDHCSSTHSMVARMLFTDSAISSNGACVSIVIRYPSSE